MMRHGTKWFSSALAMAFLALVALFISPALAWSCCCNSLPVSASAATSQKTQARLAALPPHCARPCCAREEEKVASASVTAPSSVHHVAVVKAKCDCSHDDSTPVVAGVASHSFSATVALAIPLRAFVFSFAEDARTLPCFAVAAQPRSPGLRFTCGRGPPIFSS